MSRFVWFFFIALLISGSVAQGQKAPGAVQATYRIDGRNSDIRFLIYRAGALSTFGHNHVISVAGLTGLIMLQSGLKRSSFNLKINVGKLVVDNARQRAQEGKGFSSRPTAKDIKGTRGNMLGPKLLNGAKFPVIKVSGVMASISKAGKGRLKLSVRILGKVRPLSIPVQVKLMGDRLVASGTYKLSHKQLGLKPFTALFGALAVADGIDLKYRIRAIRK